MEVDDPTDPDASSTELAEIPDEPTSEPRPVLEPQLQGRPTDTSGRRVTFAEIENCVMEEEKSTLVEYTSSVEGDEVKCYIFTHRRWRV